MKTKSYDAFLLQRLTDPELAAAYLSAAIEEGSTGQFLIALRNVAEARGGLAAISSATQLNRQTLYRTLSDDGNPTLTTLVSILREVGVRVSFVPTEAQRTG